MNDLLKVEFVSKAKYTTWLSNTLLVKMSNDNWCMSVDYTQFNKACPNDAYPPPNIDMLVDDLFKFKLLLFMDSYSNYNQIPMHPFDHEKTTFMNEFKK